MVNLNQFNKKFKIRKNMSFLKENFSYLNGIQSIDKKNKIMEDKMQANITKTEIIDLEQYWNIFIGLMERITHDLSMMIKNTPQEESSAKTIINEIFDIGEQIAEYLKYNHVIKEEYYDFVDILDLIEEILTNNFSKENIQIVINILERLNEITKYKLMLMEGNGDNVMSSKNREIFKKEYLEFERDLFYFKKDYYKDFTADKRAKEYFEIFRDVLMEE